MTFLRRSNTRRFRHKSCAARSRCAAGRGSHAPPVAAAMVAAGLAAGCARDAQKPPARTIHFRHKSR